MSSEVSGRRILRKPAVRAKLGGVAPSTIHIWMAEQGFPKPINLGPRAVGWIEAEVDSWIAARMAAREQPKPQQVHPRIVADVDLAPARLEGTV